MSGHSVQHDLVVTGLGLLSPLGDEAEAVHAGLVGGRSGLVPLRRFEVAPGAPAVGGELAEFAPETYLGEDNYRPLDRLGRLAASVVQLALADADGREAPGEAEEGTTAAPPETGLVLGSFHGGLETVVAFDRRYREAGPLYVRPFDFANSVLNAAAGQAAIRHRLVGINASVAGGLVAGHQAIATAVDLVRAGRSPRLLAAGAEALSAEANAAFVAAGWAPPGVPSDGATTPFDRRRCGFAPAEGAGCLVLEPHDLAVARGARIRGRLLGRASAFDPSRGTDPARAIRVLSRTIREALDDAGQPADAVGVVSSSANGWPLLEAIEEAAVTEAFGGRRVPTTPPKAAFGEGGGASGPWQVIALLTAMEKAELPGVAGLAEPDPSLSGVLEVGVHCRRIDAEVGLVLGVGLDGMLVVLVVGRGD